MRIRCASILLSGALGFGCRYSSENNLSLPSACSDVDKSAPSVCVLPETKDLYVVGLPDGHNWQRDGIVNLFTIDAEGVEQFRGIARVAEANAHTAKLFLRHDKGERSGVVTDFHGAVARAKSSDAYIRNQYAYGQVTEVLSGEVRLSIGADDDARVGDFYEIFAPRDTRPLARVQVSKTEAQTSIARFVDQSGTVLPSFDAVIANDEWQGGRRAPISILIVNLEPLDDKDPDEAAAGREFAKQLASALQDVVSPVLVRVTYRPDRLVAASSGRARAEQQAADFGKAENADLVIWGTMQCRQKACAIPRYTLVEGSSLARSYEGRQIWLPIDQRGLVFAGPPPAEARAFASYLLGSMFWDADRYGDASYYLSEAVRSGSMAGQDDWKARQKLSHALFNRGDIVRAGAESRELLNIIDDNRSGLSASTTTEYERMARVQLGKVEQRAGKRDVARAIYLKILSSATYDLASAEAANQLGWMADDAADIPTAREYFQKSLEISQSIGDLRGQGGSLHQLARLLLQEDKRNDARLLFEKALELAQRTGARAFEATVLHELGRAYGDQDPVKRLQYYGKSLAISRSLDYKPGIAVTTYELGRLAFQADPERSKTLVAEALDLYVELRDLQGQAMCLNALAVIEGTNDESRELFERVVELARRSGDAIVESYALVNLGDVEAVLGLYDQARERYRGALAIRERGGTAAQQASVLHSLGLLERRVGNETAARAALEKALAKYREAGHRSGEGEALYELGRLAEKAGDKHSAVEFLKSAMLIFEDTNNDVGQVGVRIVLSRLTLDLTQPSAVNDLQSLLKSAQEAGVPGFVAEVHILLGDAAVLARDVPGAKDHYSAARDAYAKSGQKVAAERVDARLRALDNATPADPGKTAK